MDDEQLPIVPPEGVETSPPGVLPDAPKKRGRPRRGGAKISVRIPVAIVDRYHTAAGRRHVDTIELMLEALADRSKHGRPRKPGTMVLNLRIPESILNRYRRQANRNGVPTRTEIRRALIRRAPSSFS